ncbi:SpoIIE family protein phosphatase [Aliiglaciecola sp. LCG003]|uniref:ATP-binding SpoIIE family protein phosphatase n=1 Tax=Aliiglaciecola sp. LCG003 TaxID=3053655 RepID=UPI0025736BFD|nr:SpoIIE family protein phosphatase [Aliiglaciecola sp. LCG003]WJG08127.1 SpoIIE family protein phosphatase [Aliiglaciecola sp. LCG003]
MRILIVDDESLNRSLLRFMLEEAGFPDCYEAGSGQQAIELAAQIDPDLVLLDVMMPDMDGYQVAPILKSMSDEIYLPIIFITALDDQTALAKCLEVGGDDFAAKPFDKLILTAKIRAHQRTRLLSRRAFEQNQELNYFRNGVQREHDIVEHIFNNALALDKKLACFFDYRLTPASRFNGDLFLAEISPSGGIFFLVGDFTGHGLASSIGALPVARSFQAMASKGMAVSDMVAALNKTLLSLLPGDMFFAAALVEISNTGQHFTIWNGGMPDLWVIKADGEIAKTLASKHMALGILEEHEFENNVEYYEAKSDERLVGYSDGVIELMNIDSQMLGEKVVLGWLSETPDMTVEDIIHKIESFRGKAEQLDDITFISYTCQNLDKLKPDHLVTQLPFNVSVELLPDQLREFDPVYDLVAMVASQLGMYGIRSDLSTVLGELFNNSLDHGLLELDSNLKNSTDGFFEFYEMRFQRLAELKNGSISISISVSFQPNGKTLIAKVSDTGNGFDIHQSHIFNDDFTYGRGIPLVKELCDNLEYSPDGSQVTATFLI